MEIDSPTRLRPIGRRLGRQSHHRLAQVQGILGHSRIQTTLDLYTDEDLEEMIAAQEKFLNAVGFESEVVQ